MVIAPDVRTITSAAEAARARVEAGRLAAALGAPEVERARFLTALTARLREHLAGGGAELTLTVREGASGEQRLMGASVRAAPPARPATDEAPPWRLTLACPGSTRNGASLTAAARRPVDAAQSVLGADEETAAVLRRLDQVETLVRLHREELHQTNQGVLALHAELAAAAATQRALLEAERTARAQAESARRLLAFLADASAAVTASLDHEDIVRRLSGLLVPEYAGQVDVWLFDDERAAGDTARPEAALAAARTDRPQHTGPDPGAPPRAGDHPRSAPDATGSVLSIPLTTRRTLGVLTLTAPGDRYDTDTRVMLIELARRTAIALDHALRYAQHRDTAEALQRAQLTDLPVVDGLRLAARYLPATRGLNIGGDWYDAFTQPDGSLLAVMGDVTGHGLRAAVIMGQLRTALRAYAVEGDGPARILTRLHRMLRHQQPNLYATVTIARFRPGDPHVVWAAAGHPPGVVRDPGGGVRVLDARPGVMLGVPVPFEYRDQAAELPPGSMLVLYTDGLVERRTRGIDSGIALLGRTLAAVDEAALEDLDTCAESLLEPVAPESERDDDVCILLCHVPAVAKRDPARSRPPQQTGTLSATPGAESRRGSAEAAGRAGGRRQVL
ncbi:PP2C family protein-serine/threonine phosphatase [Streptomyces sennicomposti]